MKAIINSTLLLKLKPRESEYDVRDVKLKGFLVRVNRSGSMNYVCEYRRGRRINIGRIELLTPAEARDKATQILGDALKGVDPRASKNPANRLTFRKFVDEQYAPWVKAHKKTGSETISRLKSCFDENFGEKLLSDLTVFSIEHWRTSRLKKEIQPATINRDINNLRSVLTKAVEWGAVTQHPFQKLKPLKIDSSPKVRYLDSVEEKKLREALEDRENDLKQARSRGNEWRSKRGYELLHQYTKNQFVDYLKPMVLLSINTGIRRGELFDLQWENVDFKKKIMTIVGKTAKSGKTRHIPLNSEVLDILKYWHEQQTDKTGYVFPGKDGARFNNVKKIWRSLLARAGVEDFRWHDMRHHFASRLVMAGVDLNTVRELLGHADITMTLRYAHLAPEHKANAVAKLLQPMG